MSKPRFTLSDLLLWISLAGLIAAVIAPMYRSMRRSATGDFVRALAISDDGGAAAALFGDGTVRVWKTADGSLMATLQSAAGSEPSVPYHAAGISILAISADGKTIAVALQARNTPASVIEVWDAANQKVVATLAAPSHCNVALAPGGDRVAWSAPRAAGLYGPSLGVSPGVALVGSPKWLPSDCAPVFSPDGQLVALRNDAGKIVLFETSTGRMQAELDIRLPPSQVSMAFSADGSKLIAMLDGMYCEFQADAAIRKGWDFSNSRRKSANVVGLTFATSIALLPGDRNLAVIDAFQTLSFIDLRTGEIREAGAAQYLAAARRGNVFVTSDGDRIDVWDAAEQAVRQSLWDQSSHVPRLVLFAVFLMWVVIYSHRKARKRLRPCAICGQPFVPQKKQSDVLECEKCRRRVRQTSPSASQPKRAVWMRRLPVVAYLCFLLFALYRIRDSLSSVAATVLSVAIVLALLVGLALAKLYLKRRRTLGEKYDLRLADECAGACGDVHQIANLVVWSAAPSTLPEHFESQISFCRQRLQAVLGQNVPPPDGMRVLIFANRQQLARYCAQLGHDLGSGPRFNGVYLFAPLRRIAIAEREFLEQTADPPMRLRGLLLHRLIEGCDRRLQQGWLTSGLASALARNDGDGALCWLQRPMKAAVLAGHTLGPSELFQRRFGTTIRRLRRQGEPVLYAWVNQFQVQAWSFVEFLCGRGSTPERRLAFQQFWADPQRHRQTANCLALHYGLPTDELFHQWRLWAESQEPGEHQAPPAGFAAWMRREPIATIVNDSELPRNRIAAIRHLGEFGFALGADCLIDVLRNDDPLLRDETISALERISGQVYGSSVSAWELWWRSLPEAARNWPTDEATMETITAELVRD